MSDGGNGQVRSRGAAGSVDGNGNVQWRARFLPQDDGYEEGFANGRIAWLNSDTASGTASTTRQPTTFFTGKCHKLGDGSRSGKRSLEESDGGTQIKKPCPASSSASASGVAAALGSTFTQGSAWESPDLPFVDVDGEAKDEDEDFRLALELSMVTLEAEQRSIFDAGFSH